MAPDNREHWRGKITCLVQHDFRDDARAVAADYATRFPKDPWPKWVRCFLDEDGTRSADEADGAFQAALGNRLGESGFLIYR